MMLILRRDVEFPDPNMGNFGTWDLWYDGNEATWADSEVQWQRLTVLVTTGKCDEAQT